MKATGIVRRIDDLGRVVIPKEIRRTMRIREGDPLEIYTEKDGEVIFKKYSPIGEMSQFASEYADAAEAVKRARVPILVLHGEDDRFVPCDMSRQIQGCCGDRVRLETFPKAAHGMCYMQDPKRYEAAVGKFLTEHLAS